MTGKQLVQCCYAVAWVGVEPTTFELQDRTIEPRRPVVKYVNIAQLLDELHNSECKTEQQAHQLLVAWR